MRNIVLDPECIENNRVVVEGDLCHYLKDVRRIREGSRIDAVIGRKLYSLVVSRILKGKIVFGVEHTRDVRDKCVPISVYQGLLKSKKMDLAVSKLGEIGVGNFFPLKTERSIPEINLEGEKLVRWRRLAREGAKISGIEDVMRIHDPIRFSDVGRILGRAKGGTVLLFSTREPGHHLKSFLDTLDKDGAACFHLFFGPEGGFSDDEVNAIIGGGGVPITMGDFIMKAETASIIGAGFIRIFFSEKV